MPNPAYFGRLIISGSESIQAKTYATLPGQASHASGEAAASVGEIANISDGSTSNLGSIVVGGGAKSVLVRYDGTNWIVISAPKSTENISSTQTANFTALSYTPPATAGRYEASAVITTTSATNTGTVQLTLDYVDSQGTVHTADVIPLCDASGSIATTKTGASKEFHSLPWKISINNAATAIVLKVVITGTVSYTISPSIKQAA